MIILDTNVPSELMKPAPAAPVVQRIGAQALASLFTTSITQAEILHGIMLLARGRRRSALEEAAADTPKTSVAGYRDADAAGRAARVRLYRFLMSISS